MNFARTIYSLVMLFIGFLALISPSLANEDETAPISVLDIQPANVQVMRFDSHARATAIVVARVTGYASVPADLVLSVTATPGLEVVTGERSTNTGDITWPVTIRAVSDGPDEGSVDFRLAYVVSAKVSKPGGATTPPIIIRRAQLKVRMKPDRDASPVDDAELSITPDSARVTDRSLIKSYLLIENKSNYPFDIGPIDFGHPDFLKVDGGQTAASVGAHETLRVPLDIRASRIPTTGDWRIVATVPLKRGTGEAERQGSAVVQQTIKVGRADGSDLRRIFGISTLLLVPGTLVLAVWSMLLGPADTANIRWLDWRRSNFWVVAITLSILISGAFIVFHLDPDYLAAFGVGDFAVLWLNSVAGAVAAFFLYRWLRRQLAERTVPERQTYEPVAGDDPLVILEKLDKANMPFHLQTYRHEVNGQIQQIFDLGFSAPSNTAWVVPQMLLQQAQFDAEADQHVRRIMEANNRPDDGRTDLLAVLRQAVEAHQVTLTWMDGPIKGPQTLALDELGLAGQSHSPLVTA